MKYKHGADEAGTVEEKQIRENENGLDRAGRTVTEKKKKKKKRKELEEKIEKEQKEIMDGYIEEGEVSQDEIVKTLGGN